MTGDGGLIRDEKTYEYQALIQVSRHDIVRECTRSKNHKALVFDILGREHSEAFPYVMLEQPSPPFLTHWQGDVHSLKEVECMC